MFIQKETEVDKINWPLHYRYGNFIISEVFDKFIILASKTLGEGTFGKVKLGTHILTGGKVAVKILEKDRIIDVADVERVSREIHILKQIRHPNIIQLYEIIGIFHFKISAFALIYMVF